MSETVSGGPFVIRPGRDVVRATGPEAEAYLQGQLSQDVAGWADGASAWSWLLAPNGKVDALLRVTRLAADDWLLDTDGGWGDAVLTRLARFKLRTKVELAPAGLEVVGWRGASWVPGTEPETAVAVVAPPWPGVAGADLFGPPGLALGVPERPADLAEADRIRAGIPKMGADLDERTIPAETGLIATTVSFTKGCYTGQELVARIDSRGGHVARRLRGLRFEGAGRSEPPAAAGLDLLGPDGGVAGAVTSVAPAEDGWIGLGYVRRATGPDAELSVAGGAGRSIRVLQVELLF